MILLGIDATLELRSLVELRDARVQERTALFQRLRARLDKWCPDLSSLCNEFNRIWQRRRLEQFPLQQNLHQAHGRTLNAFIRRHRHRPETAARIRRTRHAQPMPIPPTTADQPPPRHPADPASDRIPHRSDRRDRETHRAATRRAPRHPGLPIPAHQGQQHPRRPPRRTRAGPRPNPRPPPTRRRMGRRTAHRSERQTTTCPTKTRRRHNPRTGADPVRLQHLLQNRMPGTRLLPTQTRRRQNPPHRTPLPRPTLAQNPSPHVERPHPIQRTTPPQQPKPTRDATHSRRPRLTYTVRKPEPNTPDPPATWTGIATAARS